MRRFSTCLLALTSSILLAGAVNAGPVRAATTSGTAPNEISQGIEILRGTLTGPGVKGSRKLTGAQTAAFLRSWIAYSIFKNPAHQDPAQGAPVYTITAVQRWRGTQLTYRTFYAEDAVKHVAWIAMPPQDLGWSFVQKENWIPAQSLTVAAFHQLAQGLAIPKIGGGSVSVSAPGSHGSSSSWLKVLAAIAIVVLIAGLVVAFALRTGRAGKKVSKRPERGVAHRARTPATAGSPKP